MNVCQTVPPIYRGGAFWRGEEMTKWRVCIFMADYFKMSGEERLAELQQLRKAYEEYQSKQLQLDMSRGKPCTEQLELSMDMLNPIDYHTETGFDSRNYGVLEGLPEARRFFAELLDVQPEEIIVGGNSSLQMMYYLIDLGCRRGFVDSPRPWSQEETVKFICPVPGYDRHFRVTEYFGFELLRVDMTENGPDMDAVENLVKDPAVKGIWCVPLYSNPDGYVYSDETVRRLASMKTAAPDFKIIWDDAYCVHHLTDEPQHTLNILQECRKAGNELRPLIQCSTSKITFPGAGVSAVAADEKNVAYILKNMMPMLISYDKMNQLRHVRYLKNKQGVLEHMKKHRAILQPKFELVKDTLQSRLAPCGNIAWWTDPKGGYFISLYVENGCAKRIVQLCKEAGVVLTGAGAAYPKDYDPDDHHIRIAPSYPTLDELKIASELLTICVRIAVLEKLTK